MKNGGKKKLSPDKFSTNPDNQPNIWNIIMKEKRVKESYEDSKRLQKSESHEE